MKPYPAALLRTSRDWRETPRQEQHRVDHDVRGAAICLRCRVPDGCDHRHPLCGLSAAQRRKMS